MVRVLWVQVRVWDPWGGLGLALGSHGCVEWPLEANCCLDVSQVENLGEVGLGSTGAERGRGKGDPES